MAIEVTLMQNKSEKNRIGKDLTQVSTFYVTLKDSTSIIDPTFILTGDLPLNINYIHVLTFNRYYFVNQIISIRNNVYELRCHVDVLESFKDSILANKAIISKSENNWNLYLNDGTLQTYANSIVLTRKFPSGFTTQNYVMAIASPDRATPVEPSNNENE